MTALSELRTRAAEKFPGLPLEFDDGTSAVLKSLMSLSKDELKKFDASQKRLAALETEKDAGVDVLEKTRVELVDCLVSVADDKNSARRGLSNEALDVLSVVFEEYSGTTGGAAKSESAS